MRHPDYLFHLGWALPVLVGHWVVFGRLLAANARAIFRTTAVVTTWLVFADHLAIGAGVWSFGATHLVGVFVGRVPIEEVLFFAFTSLLVTQSLVLFLPRRFKRVPEGCAGWRYDGFDL